MNIAKLKSRTRLISSLINRDIANRYQGAIMGMAWIVINPILLLAMYTFVFSVIFKSRWIMPDGEGGLAAFGDGPFDYAIMLFSGLIIHAFLSEVLSASPKLILSNKNYVKKVVFPLEVLSFVTVGTALFHYAIKVLILVLFVLIAMKTVPATALLAPVVFVPIIPMTLGFSFILAALGVYLRDINQIMTPLLTGLLFIGPILYPVEAAPEQLRFIMRLNPLGIPLEEMRRVVIFGQLPDWGLLAIYSVVSCLIFIVGLAWFRGTKSGFADVI